VSACILRRLAFIGLRSPLIYTLLRRLHLHQWLAAYRNARWLYLREYSFDCAILSPVRLYCWCVTWKRWQSRLVDEILNASAYMCHSGTRFGKSLTQQMVTYSLRSALDSLRRFVYTRLLTVPTPRFLCVYRVVTWLILPVVICLSQRLSHACLSITLYTGRLRMAH
jgi:hypothetical protein